MGGSSDPSVLRSPGATPQKGRAAHGPRHPAVTSPPRQCYSCVRFRLLGFSGMLLGFMFGVLSLWGWYNVGLVPFKTCPLLGKLFVVLFFSLVVWLILSSSFSLSLSLSLFLFLFSLSLSLSLRCWGNPNPVWGFGFPLVFSACWPRTTSSIRTSCSAYSSRHRSRSCFFFFLCVAVVRWSVGWYGDGRSRSCSGFLFFGLWWVVVVLGLSVPCLHCMQDM